MERTRSQGFTIVELAIVLAVIMVIIGLSSGAYFGIVSKSEETAVIKMASDDLPKAIMQYKIDVGAYPGECGAGGGTRLWVLSNKDKASAAIQLKWLGPYIKPGVTYVTSGTTQGYIIDDNSSTTTYCWTKTAGVLGNFGRTAAGGEDYVIRVNFPDSDLTKLNNIATKLGSAKSEAVTTTSGSYHIDILFFQTY